MSVGQNCALDILPIGIHLFYGQLPTEYPPTHELGCLRKLSFPKSVRGKADATCLTDIEQIKRHCPGFADWQPIAVTCRMRKADYSALNSIYIAVLDVNWRIQFPLIGAEINPSRFDFGGWIEELGPPTEVTAGQDDRIDLNFAIYPHDVTFSSGS